MPKNEVISQVGQIQPRAPGVGKHMVEHEQKAEIFWAQYPKLYTGEAKTEVQPTIAGMMQNYNMNFPELHIRNL